MLSNWSRVLDANVVENCGTQPVISLKATPNVIESKATHRPGKVRQHLLQRVSSQARHHDLNIVGIPHAEAVASQHQEMRVVAIQCQGRLTHCKIIRPSRLENTIDRFRRRLDVVVGQPNEIVLGEVDKLVDCIVKSVPLPPGERTFFALLLSAL